MVCEAKGPTAGKDNRDEVSSWLCYRARGLASYSGAHGTVTLDITPETAGLWACWSTMGILTSRHFVNSLENHQLEHSAFKSSGLFGVPQRPMGRTDCLWKLAPPYPILTQRLLVSFLPFFEALDIKYPGNLLPRELKTKGRVVGSLRRLEKQFGLQFEELRS